MNGRFAVIPEDELEEMLEEAVSRGVQAATNRLKGDVEVLKESLLLPNKITHKQLADRLGVTPETVVRYIKEEGLPAQSKVGHNYIICADDLDRWLDNQDTPT